MPDYQKGKIYKLWSPQGNEIYIGSTTNPLSKRLGQHKPDGKCRSRYLFENYDDVRIELIELYPCDSKIELNKKEGEHIRNNECLNRCIAGRTKKECSKEYYENNKDYKKECNKKWRENNKEHILEKRKEWYENNKEQKKEYYENNAEQIKEYQKEYREKNAVKIKEYNEKNKEKLTEKFDCECGGKYIFKNKSRHLKTKKHLDFMNSHQ